MADSQDDKLYKAEYAKSGRASCKKCKDNIAKDSLRMAIMVQSPMFDGKVPHWHHFSCFWLRASVQSTSDISGFADLRWEDQEKVKKAMEGGGSVTGKAGGKGAGKGEKSLTDFAVEYAKSNRSTCKGCEQKIEKDQIRISKKSVDPEKPQLGLIDRWYHTGCFASRREELVFKPEYSASQLKGFAALRAEDQAELKKRLPVVKAEGKRKADSVDGVSKKQKKEEEEEKKQLEMRLKEQSQLMWGIKDKLKKYCSTNDMKELLIANGQDVPSGETNILDRLSDCMAFGVLKPCETCQGQLVFKSDAYYCTGDISAWTKCVFKTQTPNRKDWVTPKEFYEIPFLKKFKFKRQDRLFPKEPPAATATAPASCTAASAHGSAASSASSSSLPTELPTEVNADKPLTGLKVLTLGKLSKNKDELKAVVEELGGKITGTVNKATFCLSSTKEVEKMSKKMEEVRDAGIRVVAEDFLTDIKSSGKALRELISLHGISPWGAEVKLEAPASSAAAKSSGATKSSGRSKEDEGKGRGKFKKRCSQSPLSFTAPVVSEEEGETTDDEPASDTPAPEATKKASEPASGAHVPEAIKKVRAPALVLHPEQEQEVADWYRENDFFYNFKKAAFKNREQRSRVVSEKAQQLGIPVDQLTTWVKSMRDRAGKLTKKQPSGSGAQPMTDREKWILENFGYIQNFMKRVAEGKRKKGGELSQNLTSTASTRSAHVAASSSADDDSDKKDGDSEAGSSTVSKRSTQPKKKAATVQRSSSPTAAALREVLKKAAEVHDVFKKTAQPHNDEMGSRRAMAEMMYHETRQMDADTWQECQAALFQTLMHFKTVSRQRQLGPPHAPWSYQPTLGTPWTYQPAASTTFQPGAGPPLSFQLVAVPSSSLQSPAVQQCQTASSPRQLSTPGPTSCDAVPFLIGQESITPVQASTPSTSDDNTVHSSTWE